MLNEMRVLKKSSLKLAGIIVLLSAASFASPARAQGQGSNETQKTPNVTVVNRPTNPVPVRNVDGPTRQPVLTVLNGFDDTAGVIYAVPAGKLLVIEYLSARAKLPHDQGVAEAGCTTRLLGVPPVSTYFESTHMASSSSQEFFISSKLVRLYAAAETHVSVFLKRLPQTTGTGQVLFTLHGYLVDVP
jgi:hypothetical protein